MLAAIIADIVFVGMILFLVVGRRMARRKKSLVPAGMRPGPSDEMLERRVLVRYFLLGTVISFALALWLAGYFLREPVRIRNKEIAFKEQAVNRGRLLYAPTGDPTNLQALGCATCHGVAGEGGVRQFQGHSYAEPPLKYIVARYRAAGRNDEDIKRLITDAIERGRPGTPMPTWGLAFGGPLHAESVSDLVEFIYSIQGDTPDTKTAGGKKLFEANCAVCHGADGAGGIGPNLTVALQRLSEEEMRTTIKEGRLNTNRPSMPSWAWLGSDAIDALVQFLKSIQREVR